MPYWVPWPPATVARVPADHRSARSVAATRSRSARAAASGPGSLNMSSIVVTPKRSASWRAAPHVCTCASTRPGSRVRPAPSTTASPGAGASDSPTSTTRPSRTRTERRAWKRSPSNRRTSRTTNPAGEGLAAGRPGVGEGIASSATTSTAAEAARIRGSRFIAQALRSRIAARVSNTTVVATSTSACCA